MRLLSDAPAVRPIFCAKTSIGLTVALMLVAPCAYAQEQSTETKPVALKAAAEKYQTIYLSNLTQANDANDLVTDLRNMLPRARVYFAQPQSAVSILATPDDILLAQKIVSDLDHVKKIYRVTYTITETDGGKHVSTQHYALIVASGGKTNLKEGTKVPIITGTTDPATSTQSSQVQYVDVGLNIEAYVDAYVDGLRLRTKVEQSSLADEKSGLGAQDPLIRQTQLEGTTTMVLGKPLIVGSLDISGTMRHQEIEVVSELVR